jgi:hypothetical protein
MTPPMGSFELPPDPVPASNYQSIISQSVWLNITVFLADSGIWPHSLNTSHDSWHMWEHCKPQRSRERCFLGERAQPWSCTLRFWEALGGGTRSKKDGQAWAGFSEAVVLSKNGIIHITPHLHIRIPRGDNRPYPKGQTNVLTLNAAGSRLHKSHTPCFYSGPLERKGCSPFHVPPPHSHILRLLRGGKSKGHI